MLYLSTTNARGGCPFKDLLRADKRRMREQEQTELFSRKKRKNNVEVDTRAHAAAKAKLDAHTNAKSALLPVRKQGEHF